MFVLFKSIYLTELLTLLLILSWIRISFPVSLTSPTEKQQQRQYKSDNIKGSFEEYFLFLRLISDSNTTLTVISFLIYNGNHIIHFISDSNTILTVISLLIFKGNHIIYLREVKLFLYTIVNSQLNFTTSNPTLTQVLLKIKVKRCFVYITFTYVIRSWYFSFDTNTIYQSVVSDY